jgi:hypothetical protein
VILDSDQSSVKVLEYIHKRSKSIKFSSYPMISTLVLYSHHEDFDFKKNAALLGGIAYMLLYLSCSANSSQPVCVGYNIKFVDMPSTPKEIFKVVTSILFRRSMIDRSYREIKETQQSSAYPYLPIFDGANDVVDEDNDNLDDEADSLLDELALIGGTTQVLTTLPLLLH